MARSEQSSVREEVERTPGFEKRSAMNAVIVSLRSRCINFVSFARLAISFGRKKLKQLFQLVNRMMQFHNKTLLIGSILSLPPVGGS